MLSIKKNEILTVRKCVICGEDYANTPYPNRSMVCRHCKRIVKNRLHLLGAEETFRILLEKRGLSNSSKNLEVVR